MSLVPTYVKADDGNYYENPVIGGDGWFICFDDDDPAELVVFATCELEPKEIFELIGMKVKDFRYNITCGRLTDGDIEEASSYFFEPDNPISKDCILEHDGFVSSRDAIRQAVIYEL